MSPRPLDYETPREPRRKFWRLTRRQVASLLAGFVPLPVVLLIGWLTGWPWWVMLPLLAVIVVSAEFIATRIVLRRP